MTEYEKIIDKMVKKYPHARAAFQYFLEQSHYDTMEEFLFDYGYLIDYDLEKYTENEYFYIDGMNNLYYDTIKRRRTQRNSDGDTVYRYTHSEDNSEPSESEVDMSYEVFVSKITEKSNAFGVVLGIKKDGTEISSDGWKFYFKKASDSDYTQLDKNIITLLSKENISFYAIKDSIQTESGVLQSSQIVASSEVDLSEEEPEPEPEPTPVTCVLKIINNDNAVNVLFNTKNVTDTMPNNASVSIKVVKKIGNSIIESAIKTFNTANKSLNLSSLTHIQGDLRESYSFYDTDDNLLCTITYGDSAGAKYSKEYIF